MKIAIIGLGFVGLTFASVLASKGFKVIGIDIDIKKSRQIADGIPPFYEDDLEKILLYFYLLLNCMLRFHQALQHKRSHFF